VRTLEREIARLARKALRKILEGKATSRWITPENLHDFAGVRKYRHGVGEEENQVGAVTGLAWTEVGGELLTIERHRARQGSDQDHRQAGRSDDRVGPGRLSYVKARAPAMASSPASSTARISTSICPKARCPRTGRPPASAW
jgi:ATP-dependent Lon protease